MRSFSTTCCCVMATSGVPAVLDVPPLSVSICLIATFGLLDNTRTTDQLIESDTSSVIKSAKVKALDCVIQLPKLRVIFLT